MFIYSLLIIISVIFVILERTFYPFYSNKVFTYYLYFILAILFVCIAGLTDGNGLDWNAYKDISNEVVSFSDIWSHPQYEPLFLLFYKLFPTYNFFLFIFVLVNCIFISITIFRYSPYIITSIFIYICIYYFLGIMGQLRQALAISVIILAWPYIEKKSFILYVILASLIHISAIVCLLYPLIPNTIFKKKYYFLILLFFFLTHSFLQDIIFSILGSFSSGKILYYLINENNNISITFFLYKALLFFLFLYNIGKCNKFILANKFLNIYFISIILYLILSFSSSIGGRIILYFSITEVLIIPFIIKSYLYKKTGVIVYFIIIFFNIYQYYSFINAYKDIFIPYKFLFL